MLAIWFHSVFGFRPYHTLRQTRPWRTAFFAVYLLLVGVLVFNLYFSWQMRQKFPVFLQAVPEMTFEQGHLIAPPDKTSIMLPDSPYQIVLDIHAAKPPTQQEFLNQKIVLFVTEKYFYMPSVAGVSRQPLPEKLTATVTQAWLQKNAPTLRSFLQSMAFFGSLFALTIFMLFSILMAAAVVFFWSGMNRLRVPTGTIWRWAVFLQGPALVLWGVHLFIGVPLFVFALFILFNIYVQQIFNTLPDTRGNHVA